VKYDEFIICELHGTFLYFGLNFEMPCRVQSHYFDGLLLVNKISQLLTNGAHDQNHRLSVLFNRDGVSVLKKMLLFTCCAHP
jgi:hypothetical protein